MSQHKLFPFLALPKELRLMVYEFLPVRTTHYELINQEKRYRSASYKLVETGVQEIPPSIIVLHRSISGLAILSTSHFVASEANTILQPRLHALGTQPIQIITNTEGLHEELLLNLLSYLWSSDWRAQKDTRHILTADHGSWWTVPRVGSTPVPGPPSRPIHIAIRSCFVDYGVTRADIIESRTKTRMRDMLVGNSRLRPRIFARALGGYCPTRNVHIRLRVALLPEHAMITYREVQPLAGNNSDVRIACETYTDFVHRHFRQL
jgi:hypothetical protein